MGFIERVLLKSPVKLTFTAGSKVDFFRVLQSNVTIIYKVRSITGLEELE